MDRQNLKVSTPGDSAFAGNLIDIGATAEDRNYLVNNDNPDLGGNHFDGDSARAGGWSGFDIHQNSYPSTGTIYLQGVFDDHGQNFSPGVLNHLGNTQCLLRFRTESGWGSDFGGNGAYSGADISDPSTPTVITHAENLDGGFVLSYSFTAYDPANGITYTHGPVPNHIPSFGTPSWRVYYDRRETPPNMDMDDLLTASDVNPFIPEPTTIALLLSGGLLVLRPHRRA